MCATSETHSEGLNNKDQKNKAGNEIGAEGARALCDALKTNTTLTALNLEGGQQQQQWNTK